MDITHYLISQLTDLHNLQASASQTFKHGATVQVTHKIVTDAAALLKEEPQRSNLIAILTGHSGLNKLSREDNLIHLDTAIRCLNLIDIWTVCLEKLSAGSSTESLQTVSDSLKELSLRTKIIDDNRYDFTKQIPNPTVRKMAET